MTYDIAIAGSGFAGSLMAMIARRLGHSVILIERGTHPRVVIGESSTPLSNLLLETIADRYDLAAVRPLCKWGLWQQQYPHVACGLKRGFSFVHHTPGVDEPHTSARQMFVAASPNNTIADTHWYRADVDHLLMQQARALGAEYIDNAHMQTATRDGGAWLLEGIRHDRTIRIRASFLIDATGPRGFLHRALRLGESPLPGYPRTEALYSHFRGVRRYQDTAAIHGASLPYPVDDAALHHVFDGGWMWVLRFANGITSAGVASSWETAERLRLKEGAAAWERLLASLPQVQRQFADARPTMPFVHTPQISFRSSTIAGEDWAMLPSAAGFVDPLMSTGFPLALLGVLQLGEVLERDWNTPAFRDSLSKYARATDHNLLATSRLIAALYATMHDFDLFRAVSLLYFAAAAYAETVRRMGKPHLADTYLLHGHAQFGPPSRQLLERATQKLNPAERAALKENIYSLVDRIDVAGLCARPANHCYPVRAEDLFANAPKVGASHAEIEALLTRSGFYSHVPQR